MDANNNTDWAQHVFGGDWISRLEKVSERRFGDNPIAGEAANFVLEELSSENWTRLSSFKGNSHPVRYLNTVSANLLEEFSRKKFGRPRPPVWLKRNGSIWVEIWRQLCLERRQKQFILERWTPTVDNPILVGAIISTIKAKMPWCGVKNEEIPLDYIENNQDHAPTDHGMQFSEDESHSKACIEAVLLVIRDLANNEFSHGINDDITESVQQIVGTLKQSIELSGQDILILKLVYLEGMKQADVSKFLDIKPYQLNRRIKSILGKIRTALEETDGFEHAPLLDLQ